MQNVQLSVGGVTEEVSVVGEAPVIETVTTSVGQVIDQRTVQEIPLNGRHFVDLGLLIPGSVAPQPATGFLTAPLRGQGSFAFNTAGNREDTVNFMINGINLNDQVQNQITFQPSINTVQEFKVDNSDAVARSTAAARARWSTSPPAPAPTTSTARCSSSTATRGSTRATTSTWTPARRPSRSRRSSATSSAPTWAGRS